MKQHSSQCNACVLLRTGLCRGCRHSKESTWEVRQGDRQKSVLYAKRWVGLRTPASWPLSLRCFPSPEPRSGAPILLHYALYTLSRIEIATTPLPASCIAISPVPVNELICLAGDTKLPSGKRSTQRRAEYSRHTASQSSSSPLPAPDPFPKLIHHRPRARVCSILGHSETEAHEAPV